MNTTQVTDVQRPLGSSSRRTRRRKRKAPLVLGIIIAVLFTTLASFTIFANTYSKSFSNVYVGDINVSGKTQDEIRSLLDFESEKQYASVSFNVSVKDKTRTVHAPDLLVAIDSDSAALAAMEVGRKGSFVSRAFQVMGCMFNRTTIPITVKMDEEKIASLGREFSKVNVTPIDASYKVEEDVLTLSPAVDGLNLDEKKFVSTIRNKFSTFSYNDIKIEPEVAKAKRLDLDDVYTKVHTKVQDAKLEVVDGKHKVVPDVVGIDFDLNKAKETYAKNPNSEINIPLTITKPKVTTQMLQSTLFQDTLSSQTTYFSPKKVNRTSNVRLAAKKINGTILNPGEVFSFNKVVGPRTEARGFKPAQIFASGEVVDGLGGGICQVSSTLYMASMKADLRTVSRSNHSFYVDYAPKGQDATVVYGSIDFQFENTSEYPVKITAYQQDNFVTVTIKGTKAQTKKVKIKTSTISTTPYSTKTIIDNTLDPGARMVKQKGQNGIVMEAYRYVYDADGNLLSKTFENKTRYIPLTEIILVGPSGASVQTSKQPETTPQATPSTKPKPAPSSEGTTNTKPVQKDEPKPADSTQSDKNSSQTGTSSGNNSSTSGSTEQEGSQT